MTSHRSQTSLQKIQGYFMCVSNVSFLFCPYSLSFLNFTGSRNDKRLIDHETSLIIH